MCVSPIVRSIASTEHSHTNEDNLSTKHTTNSTNISSNRPDSPSSVSSDVAVKNISYTKGEETNQTHILTHYCLQFERYSVVQETISKGSTSISSLQQDEEHVEENSGPQINEQINEVNNRDQNNAAPEQGQQDIAPTIMIG